MSNLRRLCRVALLVAAVNACALPAVAVAQVDATAPTVAWQTPAEADTVWGVLNEENGNCRVGVTDDDGISRVDFYLDGEFLNRELYAPYACVWDTRQATSGQHELSAVALDNQGRSATATITVTVGSSTAPDASLGDVTPITGRTYYVSSYGSDSRDGLSPSSAWRTVWKVNSAPLQPGDGVLFEGGKAFADSALSPKRRGTASSRIVYGSYGSGRASLPKGIYLLDVSGLAFQNLSIAGGPGVLASARGGGTSDMTLENLSISDVGIAINAGNASDTNWTIRNNTIARTDDSGMILNGSHFVISGNTVSDTGTDNSILYAKHAIYLKVSDARVTYNKITRPGVSGISVRYRNSVIEHNEINGGQLGIAWYQYDATAGTSYWRYNTITNATVGCIYVSPYDKAGWTRESFVISNNTLSKLFGVYLNLHPTSGSYSVFDNILKMTDTDAPGVSTFW